MSTHETDVSGAETVGTLHPVVSGAVSRSALQTTIVLVRRELWEHRALWIAPAVTAALIALTAFPTHIGNVFIGVHETDFSDPGNRHTLFAMTVGALTVPVYLVMTIVVSLYLLDCLYQERKDRSILFWKSLPVSDAMTVISKVVVAAVVVPLGVYLIAMVSGLLFQAIWTTRVAIGSLPDLANGWNTVVWVKVEALLLYGLLIAMAWYLPFAAFLLLVSAWARKSVFLWATLPPLIALVIEKAAFGTHYVRDFLQYRSWTGFWQAVLGSVNPQDASGPGRIVSLADLFDNVRMSKAVLNIDLWLGVAVAAALLFATIRIRRYRDDT